MNHDPAPEVTARGWRSALQRFARWRHFREWEYGTLQQSFAAEHCRARRNRFSREVQFVMRPKGSIVRGPGLYVQGVEIPGDYVYPADWWHDYHEYWWSKFVADKSYE